MTPKRLTRCPFIPGRPAVPGNPRAPWRERHMRTWKGVRGKGSVNIAPKHTSSAVSPGPPSYPAHLRPRRSTLTRTARLASFPLQREKRPLWQCPPIPHTGKGWKGSGLLVIIEGWIWLRGPNLTSKPKTQFRSPVKTLVTFENLQRNSSQWYVHFHICSPRALNLD